jgi:hypothetical protein
MHRIAVWVWLVASPLTFGQFGTSLKPETLAEFKKYQANVDREIDLQARGERPFQWVEQHPDQARKARLGEVVTHAFSGSNGQSVNGALIHDWVGVIFLHGVNLDTVRDFILDTDRHPKAYAEAKWAKTLSRSGNQSVTAMRLVKKKVITVVLDIEYENRWQMVGADKWVMRAKSRTVKEIENADTPEEEALPPDTGNGFLWRMNSNWLLRQDTDGVWAELRVVSLSRDTPFGLGWIIKPLIRDFPVEGINATLRQTQQALRK